MRSYWTCVLWQCLLWPLGQIWPALQLYLSCETMENWPTAIKQHKYHNITNSTILSGCSLKNIIIMSHSINIFQWTWFTSLVFCGSFYFKMHYQPVENCYHYNLNQEAANKKRHTNPIWIGIFMFEISFTMCAISALLVPYSSLSKTVLGPYEKVHCCIWRNVFFF